VRGIDRLQTREFGSRVYVDLEIRLDGDLPLTRAHAIAEQVHDRIERDFPSVKHIMVHVNPDE
jgi:divalent metal cation (Fe/Co/Zn/Cd) transporter